MVSIPELDLILKFKREEDYQQKRFAAGLQGVDLDKNRSNSVEKRLEEVRQRAALKLAGSQEELDRQEFSALGFDFNTV
jgi:hypothetical protein